MFKNGSSAKAHTEDKMFRVTLNVLPEDYAKLKFAQAQRSAGRPSTESFSVLAHDMWLSRLPSAPRKFKVKSRHTSAST